MGSKIRVEKLRKSWNGFSLRNINFEVEAGEYFVLLGPIGSGKTLLLETLAGLHRPDSGEIFIGKDRVTDWLPEWRKIGFVYQRSMLFPHLSVEENILFGLKFHRGLSKKKNEILKTLVDLLRLEPLLHRGTTHLSGGEMQKVALARALAIEPQILLLDEPLSPLDNLSKEELRDRLKKLHRILGTTILEVTHDQITARMMADRVGIIRKGHLIQVGSIDEVYNKPENDFVAEFMGTENIFAGSAKYEGENCRLKISDQFALFCRSKKEGSVGFCIRPENINLFTVSPINIKLNLFQGTVTQISDRGPMVQLTLNGRGVEFQVLVMWKEFRKLGLNVGLPVFFELPIEQIHVFSSV